MMLTLPAASTFRLTFYVAASIAAVAALAPSPEFERGFENADKVQHIVAFAVLTALALFGFPQAPGRLIVERLSFFGAAIEVLQSIPMLHRDCDALDWGADTVAVALTVLVLPRLIPALRARAG